MKKPKLKIPPLTEEKPPSGKLSFRGLPKFPMNRLKMKVKRGSK